MLLKCEHCNTVNKVVMSDEPWWSVKHMLNAFMCSLCFCGSTLCGDLRKLRRHVMSHLHGCLVDLKPFNDIYKFCFLSVFGNYSVLKYKVGVPQSVGRIAQSASATRSQFIHIFIQFLRMKRTAKFCKSLLKPYDSWKWLHMYSLLNGKDLARASLWQPKLCYYICLSFLSAAMAATEHTQWWLRSVTKPWWALQTYTNYSYYICLITYYTYSLTTMHTVTIQQLFEAITVKNVKTRWTVRGSWMLLCPFEIKN